MDLLEKVELRNALEAAHSKSSRAGKWSTPREVSRFTDAKVTTGALKQLVHEGSAAQKGTASLFKPTSAGAFGETGFGMSKVNSTAPGGGKGPGGSKGPGGFPGKIPDPGKGPGPDPGNFGYMAPPNSGGGGGKDDGGSKGKGKGKPKGHGKPKGKPKGSKPGRPPKTPTKPDYPRVPDVSKSFPKLPSRFVKPPRFEEFREVPKGKAKLPYPEPDPTDMFSMPKGKVSIRGNLKNTLGRGIGSLIVGAPVGPGPAAGAGVSGPTLPLRG